MEVIFASIFFGMIFAAVLILFIVLGHSEVPGDNNIDAESSIFILQNLEISLSRGERVAIEYAIDSIRIREKLEVYLERSERNDRRNV